MGISDFDLLEALNQGGNERWELVSSVSYGGEFGGGESRIVHVLKRPKE
jgi:copper homeostasis protein CutC